MISTPVVLGINRTADGSVCLIGGPEFMISIQKERYTRQKHHWGRLGDLKEIYAKHLPSIRQPIDLVVECFSSDPEAKKLIDYRRELNEVLRFRSKPRIICISHHLAHLYSAFFLSPYPEAAVMVSDFQGSRVEDTIESWSGKSFSQAHWVEVSSYYVCNSFGIQCLGKQLWNNDRTKPMGLGSFYNYLTHVIFPGRGMEGKVMGLAPYGNPDALGLPPLEVKNNEVFIPRTWLNLFKERDRFRYFRDGSGSFEECAHLAAAGQRSFEEAQLQLAKWLHRQTGTEALCLAGGVALNCVANGRLLRESPFRDVFVPPSPHDGGTALGCALYGVIEVLGHRRHFRWVNDFLGPEPSLNGFETLLFERGHLTEKPVDLIGRIADLLESGRVVALFHGRSELGPRALGHRSILADPRRPSMRAWINKHVKGRELFRPLAPVALEEIAPTFFEIDRPVPFMQFAVKVRSKYDSRIPAVTHIDGTARLQTVSQREDAFLYALLKAFEARTGVGILLNTSLNSRGEPIVETAAEALTCFETTSLHALAVPPYLLRKRSEPAAPSRNGDSARQEELALLKRA